MQRDIQALTKLSALLLLLLWPALAVAQVTGSIAGIIRDASGAVLPGVTVTIKGPALQRESVSATTNADGAYRIQLVPPGRVRRDRGVGGLHRAAAKVGRCRPQSGDDARFHARGRRRLRIGAGLGRRAARADRAVRRHEHRDAAHHRRAAAERPQFHRSDRARARARGPIRRTTRRQRRDLRRARGRCLATSSTAPKTTILSMAARCCASPRIRSASSKSSRPATRPSSAARREASPTS